MLRAALIGLGKMGISHLAIIRCHPEVELVAVCDTAGYMLDVLTKYAGIRGYGDYRKMLDSEALDIVIIATPSKTHGEMVSAAIERGLHVFCEKPFVLDVAEGERLAAEADRRGLVTQVGYHYRFVGAFREAARIVHAGALGAVHHVRAEAYGPVVLRPKGGTWRLAKSEGGGCLYDYACHALDLVNYIVGMPASVDGVILNKVFSADVEDEVYCSLHYANGAGGQLAANWSDESFRKMYTKVTVWGANGSVAANRQECQIYLREPHAAVPEAGKGWLTRYTTDLTEPVWYYLRGEEYSAQIDNFVNAARERRRDNINSFRSALETDRLVAMILAARDGAVQHPPLEQDHQPPVRHRAFGGLFR